jgi:hypothetical protein
VTGDRLAGIAAFAVVVAGVAIGFATIGTPQHVRLVERDHRRVSDLERIEAALRVDPSTRGTALPALAGRRWPRDPLTGKPYVYLRETATRYRLCATFELPSDAAEDDGFWRHGPGLTCFREDSRAGGTPDRGFAPIELR